MFYTTSLHGKTKKNMPLFFGEPTWDATKASKESANFLTIFLFLFNFFRSSIFEVIPNHPAILGSTLLSSKKMFAITQTPKKLNEVVRSLNLQIANVHISSSEGAPRIQASRFLNCSDVISLHRIYLSKKKYPTPTRNVHQLPPTSLPKQNLRSPILNALEGDIGSLCLETPRVQGSKH